MIFRSKKFDLRMVDFLSGRKVSPPKDEWKTCACCGQAIVKGWEMSNAHVVGEDCEDIISRYTRSVQCFGSSVEEFVTKWERTCGKMKPAIKAYLKEVS